MELPGQCAHQGQGAWPQLPAGSACGQGSMMLVATAVADAAQTHVFDHDGFDFGQLEDLMAHGFVAIGLHRCPAGIALRWRHAFDALADFGLGHHGPKAAFVSGLSSQAFAAFGAGGTRWCAGAIAGGRPAWIAPNQVSQLIAKIVTVGWPVWFASDHVSQLIAKVVTVGWLSGSCPIMCRNLLQK